MLRCIQNSFPSLGSSSLLIILVLGFALCYQLRSNSLLRELIQQETSRTKKIIIERDADIERLSAESRQKDNRTQEIYNLKGVCENQLATCRKQQTESDKTLAESRGKLESFIKNNKICSDDLKELRDLFDKKKNEAENNFYLFQQKYKDTEFGIKIVDILDIFRFSRSDVEDLLNKLIIQRESNQDSLENNE